MSTKRAEKNRLKSFDKLQKEPETSNRKLAKEFVDEDLECTFYVALFRNRNSRHYWLNTDGGFEKAHPVFGVDV